MKQVSVTGAGGGTLIVPAGIKPFVHILPVDGNIYIKYDGGTTTLTTVNGFLIVAGQPYALDDPHLVGLFRHPIYAITDGSTVDVRIQGAE